MAERFVRSRAFRLLQVALVGVVLVVIGVLLMRKRPDPKLAGDGRPGYRIDVPSAMGRGTEERYWIYFDEFASTPKADVERAASHGQRTPMGTFPLTRSTQSKRWHLLISEKGRRTELIFDPDAPYARRVTQDFQELPPELVGKGESGKVAMGLGSSRNCKIFPLQ